MSALDQANKLKAQFGDLISAPTEFRGEVSVEIADSGRIAEVCDFAKRELGFDFLVDLSTLDNYGDDPRWTAVYELAGLETNVHLRLRTHVSEEKSELPSVSSVWATANWHEREAYDMMGVRFSGHPDLRRILMWEGYPYFPLRKDFPLAGKPTEMPDVAFSKPAPLEGGPFVTSPGAADAAEREPRAKHVEQQS
ncbi:MAG TPA: NADH-quinone oxidoreductase subunit C [Verrucomicrobiales bacterium]|nr:NADH-quinone oxidoreductase subunit C [Verrucomicrobiales bacterium]